MEPLFFVVKKITKIYFLQKLFVYLQSKYFN